MADYCTLADIKTQIPESAYASTATTDYDDSLTQLIGAASRLIDGEVGRWDNFFYPSTADETRYYDGVPGAELPIDEFVSITSVAVSQGGSVTSSDYTALAAGDYYAMPYNHTANGKPINKLVMDYINGSGQGWYAFRKGVQVVGIPGYSATPPAKVTQACIIQVVQWLQASKQMYQEMGASIQIGGLSIKGNTELDPNVKNLLYSYKLELG
jgi:hypothetical protein